jgi:hypothetical protein
VRAVGFGGLWRPNSLMRSLTGEDTMRGQQRRAWHVRRTSVPTPTGQQRWDRAYQLLLQWAMTVLEATQALGFPILPVVFHASSDLRACLDQPPIRPPDD